MTRSGDLQRLIAGAEAAFDAQPSRPAGSAALARRVFRALDAPGSEAAPVEPSALPALDHLPAALAAARRAGGPVAGLADALAALAPRLAFMRRPAAETDPPGFLDGHANADLVGARGLERRGDVRVGLSLVAPGVRYPDHRHAPEELYVVMSAGEWRQEDGPWHAPGPGGLVHNPPWIRHAMRAGDAPLLALWFLWTG